MEGSRRSRRRRSPGSCPQAPRTGVVAIARRPAVDVAALLADERPAPIVLLEDPRTMGNMGACVRVAAAAGAAGVLTTGGNDPWHPDALRGAAGLHYALPVAAVEALPEGDRPLVAIDPGGEDLAPGSGARRGRSSPSAPSATGSATGCWRAPTRGSGSRCARASPASTWRPRWPPCFSRRAFEPRPGVIRIRGRCGQSTEHLGYRARAAAAAAIVAVLATALLLILALRPPPRAGR